MKDSIAKVQLLRQRVRDKDEQIAGLEQRLSDEQASHASTMQALRAMEADRDELLYHSRHASPDDISWCAPKTVGHLRRQLEMLDPNMAIGCAYFLNIHGVNVARTTGVSMSYERVDNTRNRIDSTNKNIPKGIIIWAHSTDAEGREKLSPALNTAVVAAGSAMGVGEGDGAVATGARPGGSGVGMPLVDVGLADPATVSGAVVAVRDGEAAQQQDGQKVHTDSVSPAE